jgi:serine protease Do
MKTSRPASALLVVLSLLAAAPARAATDRPGAPVTTPKPTLKIDSTPIGPGTNGRLTSYADVIGPAQQAVVSVYSTKSYLTAARGLRQGQGLGSGVIVSSDGFILTNNHVVEGAEELKVALADGRELPAKIIGSDDKTDIALIRVEADRLPFVTLADSDKVRVGDIVFAIGNPLEVGQTVTMGIVSATRRSELGMIEDGGYENFIQTDAAINQGNSGGALIDARGRLVGINSAIISNRSAGNIGIGFAIPTNLVADITRNLVEHGGKVVRGYLGIGTETLVADKAEALKLPRETRGVRVTTVASASPAAKAGFKEDDVITSVAGRPVASLQELRLTVSQLAPGTEAAVKFFRAGKEITAKAIVGTLPGPVLLDDELLLGVKVQPLTPEVLNRYYGTGAVRGSRGGRGTRGGARGAADPTSLPNLTTGLIVSDLKTNSPYYDIFDLGVIILKINQTEVTAETDVTAARKLLKTGPNTLSVYYLNRTFDLPVTVR